MGVLIIVVVKFKRFFVALFLPSLALANDVKIVDKGDVLFGYYQGNLVTNFNEFGDRIDLNWRGRDGEVLSKSPYYLKDKVGQYLTFCVLDKEELCTSITYSSSEYSRTIESRSDVNLAELKVQILRNDELYTGDDIISLTDSIVTEGITNFIYQEHKTTNGDVLANYMADSGLDPHTNNLYLRGEATEPKVKQVQACSVVGYKYGTPTTLSSCSPFYDVKTSEMYAIDSNPSKLFKFDVRTGLTEYMWDRYTGVGGRLEALGCNLNDGYLYAWNESIMRLIKINPKDPSDTSGSIVEHPPMSIYPSGGTVNQGTYYLFNSTRSSILMEQGISAVIHSLKLDGESNAWKTLSLKGSQAMPHDISFYPKRNNVAYGIYFKDLVEVDLSEMKISRLATLDISGVDGYATSSFDSEGNLIVLYPEKNKLFKVDVSDYSVDELGYLTPYYQNEYLRSSYTDFAKCM
ncbi:hypothetical protein [Vibrio coralliirubri]|uniref:hypothetical protein n=2 Tax=Vibrio coralliirubri TaxID=1516159 RepID=UPI0021C3B717|nr:hypothetical protein [Vibrio coralliirubri]